MSNSILQNEKECYICGRRTFLERHHVFAGMANRRISESWGLWLYLCQEHHRGAEGAQYNRELGDRLKQDAQRAFEKKYGHEKWMSLIMKNYLEDDDHGKVLP